MLFSLFLRFEVSALNKGRRATSNSVEIEQITNYIISLVRELENRLDMPVPAFATNNMVFTSLPFDLWHGLFS
jgi:hypothetical protein